MIKVTTFAIIMLLSYLIGSFPTGLVIGRMLYKKDPRDGGSGATGATNVARQFGKKAGILVMLIDAAKGALAVYIALSLCTELLALEHGEAIHVLCEAARITAALCVVIGHIFPIFAAFKGGKGVATGAGALLAIAPIPGIASAVAFALILGLTKIVSLSSMVAALAYPVALAFGQHGSLASPVLFWGSVLMACIVLFAHRSNIVRILKGEEKSFNVKRHQD
jgi:glycerol-3-phosphate acyltransferase PlsY